MSERAPRRLSRHDQQLLRSWNAELEEVEVPADLGGAGLGLAEVVRALCRVAVHRTAVEADPELAGVLLAALEANDAEHRRLVGGVRVDPDDTEVAATRRHLAGLLAGARDRGCWARRRGAVLAWVRRSLAVGAAQGRAVEAVVAALDDTAGADPEVLADVLDARDVPALLWLLAGLAATGEGGAP